VGKEKRKGLTGAFKKRDRKGRGGKGSTCGTIARKKKWGKKSAVLHSTRHCERKGGTATITRGRGGQKERKYMNFMVRFATAARKGGKKS